ncbi:MAG: hypothetical protein V2J55_07995 [Candidatus Competibacteraceae bacterium]|jgi:hypothetical protein|nr:hypothetical protein [Candidatus Competibacteraceae bacterium]
MFDWQFVTGTAVIVGVFGFLLLHLVKNIRKSLALKAQQAQRAALEREAAKQAAAEKAAREKAVADNLARIKVATDEAAARKQVAEQIAQERAAAKKEVIDQTLAEWIKAEEAETRKTAAEQAEEEQRDTEMAEKKLIHLDYALREWYEKMHAELEDAGSGSGSGASAGTEWESLQPREKKDRKKVDAVKEQVLTILHQLEKETDDMEFIVSTIETSVDFLPIQVADTISKWKKGELHRYHTLSDLKHKFRYMAYSIEDGWALHHVYSSWLEKLHNKLFVFAKLLGTEPEKKEDILSVITRIEQAEWKKQLKMNMEVVFVLKQMRGIHTMILNMQRRLKDLETVCRKRSEQIIKPVWDPSEKR